MAQCGPQITIPAHDRIPTLAPWQVTIEKLRDRALVEVLDHELALIHPLRNVRQAEDVVSRGGSGVAAIIQITLKGVEMRRKGTCSELIDGPASTPLLAGHHGLLKLLTHFSKPQNYVKSLL